MKWKRLMVVLIGLLMIGMTTGVASAGSITEKSIQPQYFGDKDQLHLEFDQIHLMFTEVPSTWHIGGTGMD
ncbi:hypothetical protein [Thermococcus barophilus]|uniref:Uncharacterized protein n=1 Tax=Thermococcus barophilus TaxID=55802 RepID=A0A0S1X8M3_THEBA|nr:hypothetical protein [Thermococcus barophilus]ALM74142.1 exported hypothetical protein [Thermococcus barophilus]